MKRNLFQKLGDFVLGKGFYIVLFLCVAAIGISGYYLIRTVTGGSQPSEPVTANPTVTLPDSSAQEAPSTQPLEEETPEEEPPAPAVQEDDPQPVKEPTQEEVSTQPEYKEVVYTWPVKGQVLRAFTAEALAYDPTMGDWRTHCGVDIAAEAGLKVLAAGEGPYTPIWRRRSPCPWGTRWRPGPSWAPWAAPPSRRAGWNPTCTWSCWRRGTTWTPWTICRSRAEFIKNAIPAGEKILRPVWLFVWLGERRTQM